MLNKCHRAGIRLKRIPYNQHSAFPDATGIRSLKRSSSSAISIMTKILIVFFAIVTLAYGDTCPYGTWCQMPGHAKEISAKCNELWALDTNYNVQRWVNGSWTTIPYLSTNTDLYTAGVVPIGIAASPDGSTWITMSNYVYYRWNPTKQRWEYPAGGLQWRPSASTGAYALGTNSLGAIWWIVKNNVGPVLFDVVTGNVSLASIGVPDCNGSSEIWVVETISVPVNGHDTNGNVRRYNPQTKQLELRPGQNVATISVHSANRIVMTTKCCKVYMWNGIDWTRLPQNGCKATINENAVYVLDEGENIFYASA